TAASSGPGAAVNPKAITRQVRRIASHFTPGRQEDAHDLYLAMLAQMEGVLLHGLGGREAHPDMRSRETTFMGHCFLGYVRYQAL
ncbi:ubiquitin carboxyl-terminal hydrolase 36/42, partial [Haematococcus lacustris]